jgi:hypothetical protein
MPAAEVVVNAKEIEEQARDIDRAKRALIGRLAERGYQLLREEVPYQTGNLKQGVAPPDVDYQKLEALLTVSARSAARGGEQGTVYGADGKEKKKVTLRPRPAFNYAAAVAQGRAAISPKNGRALLIPVPTAPAGEGYLLAGGQIYIFRRSAAATQPNPFDERAARRLENESVSIAEKVLEQFV